MALVRQWHENEVTLRFTTQHPFALCERKVISVARLATDLEQLKQKLSLSQGNVLVCCKSRYAFSVGLLATWLSGRIAILPPNFHQVTLDHIVQAHGVTAQLHDDFLDDLNVMELAFEKPCLELSFDVQQAALVIYTSGSSGQPKAMQKTIGNLFSEVFSLQSVLPESSAPLLASVPPNHLYGLTFSILLPWVLGVAVVDECPLHASEVADAMRRMQADTLITVPVHLRAMLEQDINYIPKHVIVSAGSVDPDLAKRWYDRFSYEVIEVYGSSETGIVGYRQQLSDECWQTFPNVNINQYEGCLQVTSPFIHSSEGDVFQSNDRVSLQQTGFILHGRADSIVKIAGKRVSLLSVEAALKSCDGVLDAAVIAVPVKGYVRDMAIWAALACEDVNVITPRDVRAMLHSKLDSVEIPRRIVVNSTLPRETNGKLPRDNLLALFENNQ